MTRDVKQWRTQAQAAADINFQIVEKFGSDPAVMDDLCFQVLPVCDEQDGREGIKAIAAYPAKEGAKSDKLMVALYG